MTMIHLMLSDGTDAVIAARTIRSVVSRPGGATVVTDSNTYEVTNSVEEVEAARRGRELPIVTR